MDVSSVHWPRRRSNLLYSPVYCIRCQQKWCSLWCWSHAFKNSSGAPTASPMAMPAIEPIALLTKLISAALSAS